MMVLSTIQKHFFIAGAVCAIGAGVLFFPTDLLDALAGKQKNKSAVAGNIPMGTMAHMIPATTTANFSHSPRSSKPAAMNMTVGITEPMSPTSALGLSLLSSASVVVPAYGGSAMHRNTSSSGGTGMQIKTTSRPTGNTGGGGGGSMAMTSFYAMASARLMGATGAISAPQMASFSAQPRKLGGLNPPVIDDGDNNDPENPDLPQPPVPLGDAICFSFALAAAFACFIRKRRKA